MKGNVPIINFNGGEVGQEVIARVDQENYPSTQEVLSGFFPMMQGPAMTAPGTELLLDVGEDFNHVAMSVTLTDAYDLIFLDGKLAIVDDSAFITRPTPTATVSALSAWTLANATESAGVLSLNSDGVVAATASTTISPTPDVACCIDIVVDKGPVILRIEDSVTGVVYDDNIATGNHHLSFTPGGTVAITLSSTEKNVRRVSRVQTASAGRLEIDVPWSLEDFKSLRMAQSGDVIYVTSGTGSARKIEHRGSASWSVVAYETVDGPWRLPNTDKGRRITPSATSGAGTMVADADTFDPKHVGALWKLTHTGQSVEDTFAVENSWTDYIKVTGVNADRYFYLTISGTWTGTVWLQRSIGNVDSWTNWRKYTANVTDYKEDDTLDNNIIYYRVGFGAGGITSGAATVALEYSGGKTDGVAKITGYTDARTVDIDIIDQFGSATSTWEWTEGLWSDYRGWPKALTIFNERLYTDMKGQFRGSYVGAYASYKDDGGDSSVVRRTLDVAAEWLLPLGYLIIGSRIDERGVRMGYGDEQITPNNFTVRPLSSPRGSANVSPIAVGSTGVFVARDGCTICKIGPSESGAFYLASSMLRKHRDLGRPGVSALACTQHPDQRIFAIREDGVLLHCLFAPEEQIEGWGRRYTDGKFRGVAVRPASGEDVVTFHVERELGGSTRHYLERMSSITITDQAEINRMDCATRVEGSGMTTITGADRFNGKSVSVWADGKPHRDKTVSGGSFALDFPADVVWYGLPFNSDIQTTMLAYGARGGTALGMRKGVKEAYLIVRNSVAGEIYIGQDFDDMERIVLPSEPSRYDNAVPITRFITDNVAVPGGKERDARLCVRVKSPYHAEIQGIVINLELDEKL